jgi:acyl dehydratase
MTAITDTDRHRDTDGAWPASLTFDEIAVGDALPEAVIDVSTKTIVATAIASRDYQDVHHDRDLAQQRGSKDIFMNILSSNGFVLRFVTDWAGPEAIVKQANIRLGVPNYAGDEMRMTGQVTEVTDLGDEGQVAIAVRGANSLGDHVTGTVTITVPKEA